MYLTPTIDPYSRFSAPMRAYRYTALTDSKDGQSFYSITTLKSNKKTARTPFSIDLAMLVTFESYRIPDRCLLLVVQSSYPDRPVHL